MVPTGTDRRNVGISSAVDFPISDEVFGQHARSVHTPKYIENALLKTRYYVYPPVTCYSFTLPSIGPGVVVKYNAARTAGTDDTTHVNKHDTTQHGDKKV